MLMNCDKFKSKQAHSLALFSMSAITTLNPKAEVARAAAALHVSAPCCFEIIKKLVQRTLTFFDNWFTLQLLANDAQLNIGAARGLQDVLKTNLGPKGTMKMYVCLHAYDSNMI